MSLESFRIPKFTCPRHRLYNPERHGQGAIKGGCEFCTDTLSNGWKMQVALRGEFDGLAERIVRARAKG